MTYAYTNIQTTLYKKGDNYAVPNLSSRHKTNAFHTSHEETKKKRTEQVIMRKCLINAMLQACILEKSQRYLDNLLMQATFTSEMIIFIQEKISSK